jgi:hypothetical protein
MARIRRRTDRPSATALPPQPTIGPELRAYLRLKVRAARKRVYCLPEQWICGRCGTGLVPHPSRAGLYQHYCHREHADALLERVRSELRGDL